MYLSNKRYYLISKKAKSFILPLETVLYDGDRIVGTFRSVVMGFIRWRSCGRPQIIFPGFSDAFGFAPGHSVVFDSVQAIFQLDGVIVREDRITVYDRMGVRPYGID